MLLFAEGLKKTVAVSIVQASSVVLGRVISKALSISETSTVTRAIRNAKILSLSETSSVSVIYIKGKQNTLSIAQSSTLVLNRAIALHKNIASTNLVLLNKLADGNIFANMTSTSSTILRMRRPIDLNLSAASTTSLFLSKSSRNSIANSSTTSLVFSKNFTKSLPVATASLTSLPHRYYSKNLLILQTHVEVVTRAITTRMPTVVSSYIPSVGIHTYRHIKDNFTIVSPNTVAINIAVFINGASKYNQVLYAADSSTASLTKVKYQYNYEEIVAEMQDPQTLIPTTTPLVAKYRGASSSSDYNNFTRSVYSDILTIFSSQQQQLSEVALANEIITQQYNATNQQLSELEADMTALLQTVAGLKALASGNSANGTITISKSLYDSPISYGGFTSYYPVNGPLSSDQRADYSARYSQILPKFASAPQSKAFLVDSLTNTNVFPPGVLSISKVTSTPTATPFNIEENDISLAVDGDETTFYRRNMYYTNAQNIEYVDVTYTLTIPEQFVNNLLCNYVTVHPYPEFGVEIMSVVAHGPLGSRDTQLLNTDAAGNIIPITSAGKFRLIFSEQEITSIDIVMRQNNGNETMKAGLQAFSSGAAVIDVGYIAFSQVSSRVLIPFNLNNNFFRTVTSIGPTVSGVNFNLWALNSAGDLQPINVGAILPSLVSTIYVEVVLSPAVGIVPIVEDINVQFLPIYSS